MTPPLLPAGWVAANAVNPDGILWVTSTTTPDSAPNDAFINDPSVVSDKRLDTPNIAITAAGAQVSFRNNYALEPIGGGANFFDGAVLEVSSPNIAGGAFTDITNAAVGGSFVTGGYNGTISTSFSNPIGGRMAWSQSSGGYINTVANLGPNVVGQTIKLRFRMCSDSSVTGTGWRIDNVVVTGGGPCGNTNTVHRCTPTLVLQHQRLERQRRHQRAPRSRKDSTTSQPWCLRAGSCRTTASLGLEQPGWFQGNDTVFPAQGRRNDFLYWSQLQQRHRHIDLEQLVVNAAVARCRTESTLSFWTRTVDTPAFPDRLQVRMSTNGASTNVGTTATERG